MAWDVLDKKTRSLLKEEIMSIYRESDGEFSIDDICEKLEEKVPVEVIIVAVGELIEEGKVIEEDVDPGDILAITRQNKKTLERLEKKVDIVADGLVKVLRLLKGGINNDSKKQVISETKNSSDSKD
jgi:hypothetical protein